MKICGVYQIPASPEKVWAALNSPDSLRAAIPGCTEVVRGDDDENEFAVAAKIKLGPLGLHVKGKLRLSELNPPHGCRISGEGADRAAGFAKGDAAVRLEKSDGGTKLSYDAEAKVGGKMAQLGARLIDAAAKKYADQFFATLATDLGGGEAKPPEEEAKPALGMSRASKISLGVFAALLLIAVLALLLTAR
jgi:carbon monoxide dehydrogenase subunit G